MKINFIRHGMTAGNFQKRYIGITDEPLCRCGIEQIRAKKYPPCKIVAVSSMKRCVETAKLIYPEVTPIFRHDLRECNFGDFEGKNYKELAKNPDYQRWIDSGGILDFPNGESINGFKRRCGGTISAILENLAVEKKNFYEWSVANGEGYIAEFDGSNLMIIGEI